MPPVRSWSLEARLARSRRTKAMPRRRKARRQEQSDENEPRWTSCVVGLPPATTGGAAKGEGSDKMEGIFGGATNAPPPDARKSSFKQSPNCPQAKPRGGV